MSINVPVNRSRYLSNLHCSEVARDIVTCIDGLQAKVDALKQLQSQTRAEIDALLPSVLDKAFKGEL
jgi:type I restriction enzyme S subunit